MTPLTRTFSRFWQKRSPLRKFFVPLLDILTLAAWGILMLHYWLSGKLALLIHPNYFGLVIATGIAFLLIAATKSVQLYRQIRRPARSRYKQAEVQHTTLFPPGWSSILLLSAAILGLAIAPQPFASQKALQRGVAEAATLTRTQPQAFRSASNSEERTLIEWIRQLNVYPEPDHYTGQKARVQGFVVHPPELPPEYLMLTRFVITCCAADAYPVALPVKLDKNRDAYPPDQWLDVEGQMITETLNGTRQLTIEANSIEKIPEPENPYYY